MKLPLAEEVRQARKLADEAVNASTIMQRCDSILTALAVLDHQVRVLELDRVDILGDDVIVDALATFPQLSSVREIDPDPETPVGQQIRQRVQQLQAIKQLLAPVAATHDERSRYVHELQHRQHHLLSQPEYAELRAELFQQSRIRSDAARAIVPLKSRRQLLMPAEISLRTFLPVVYEELEAAETDPFVKRMVHARVRTIHSSLLAASQVLGFSLLLPDHESLEEPDVPLETVRAAVRKLEALQDGVQAEIERLDAEIRETEDRLEASTSWILDRTG